MVIYTLSEDCNEIKKGTKFLFNKSMQRFEAVGDKDIQISNYAPFSILLKLKIHRILTEKSECKKTIFIPF
jgi:hypothetical protein